MREASRKWTEDASGPASSLPERLGELVRQADEDYRHRAGPKTGSAAAAFCAEWRKYVAAQDERSPATGASYDVEWRLSRAFFLAGDESPASYARGAVHGRRAVGLDRSRVEGHFWTGVNMALHAQATKGLRGALAVLEARRALIRACRISPGYHGAGPLRVLGRIAHKSPRVLGGGFERSLGYYEQALEVAPANTVTLIYAAELQIDRGEPRKAAMLLRQVLSLPVDQEWEFENIRDKTLAESMLGWLTVVTNGHQ